MSALVTVMLFFLLWALVAGRLARWGITAPLAMVAIGVAATAGSDPLITISLDTGAAEVGVEIILALLLFIDATEVPVAAFRQQRSTIIRMLGIALPLSLVLAWLLGLVFFPDLNWWLLAVLATIVVPVDLAPAGAVLRDRRIPTSVREALNVESGLNDGFIAPLFLFCLAGATAGAGGRSTSSALLLAVPTLLVAIGVGLVVGLLGARLMIAAVAAGWTEASALRLGVLALPLVAFGSAVLLSGSGFLAAFVAGICFGRAARRFPVDALHLTEDVSTMLTLVLWFAFGQIINQTIDEGGLWIYVPYAAVALTVVRMVPVAIALIGTEVNARDRLVLGWLGPRGLASLVFGLLAYLGLQSPENGDIANIMVATVVLSVVCHGLTARLIGAWYGRRPDGLPENMVP